MPAQTMVVARTGDGDTQQILVLIHGLDDGAKEEQELCVLFRRAARLQKVFALICGKRPVVVLARAVEAGKGLFVQQAGQPMALGDFLHDLHS